MLYDRQTRSMLQTDQPHPSLGSQSGTVEQNADGSTDLYFGPQAPAGKEHNWIQTIPGKGWFGRSCASTARCSRSSTRPGVRARSSPSAPAPTDTTPSTGR